MKLNKFWEDWTVVQPERFLLRKHISEKLPFEYRSVLDVGGGDGKRYKDLFNYRKYTSLDYDPKLNPDVVASADCMPFEDKTFDLVFSSQMLEHVLYPEKCIMK